MKNTLFLALLLGVSAFAQVPTADKPLVVTISVRGEESPLIIPFPVIALEACQRTGEQSATSCKVAIARELEEFIRRAVLYKDAQHRKEATETAAKPTRQGKEDDRKK